MKSTAIALAIATASLGFGSLAYADDDDRRGKRDDRPRYSQQHDHDRYERRDDRRDYRNDRRSQSRQDSRRQDYRGPVYYYNARGPEFRRGGYMPRTYRNQQYHVINHRSHRLAPPPRNHVWVQVGGDYVLMAVATGIIASIILSH